MLRQKRRRLLSLSHKAAAALGMYRDPGALEPHLHRAEASTLRQLGVGKNELTRILDVLSASCICSSSKVWTHHLL